MSRPPRKGRSPIATSSSVPLSDWLAAVVATPGLTAIRDLETARAVLLDDALRALPLLGRFGGPLIDVGSGGGSPGIPLATALPGWQVTLLEAERRKCDFLRRFAPENARVVWGRAEEQPREAFGVAAAKALAPPPVAAEWCLPLVRVGGAAILWTGPSANLAAVARVCELLGAAGPEEEGGLVVLRKLRASPPGFPRRPGVARKRPLA